MDCSAIGLDYMRSRLFPHGQFKTGIARNVGAGLVGSTLSRCLAARKFLGEKLCLYGRHYPFKA